MNMGSADRRLRAFVLAPLLVVASSCPLYVLFGLRTCPLQEGHHLRRGPAVALGSLRDVDSVVPMSLVDRIKELLTSG